MAAALVGGAFISASVSLLIDKLAPHGTIWDFFQGQNSDSKKLLRKLNSSLLFVSKVLDDAEKKEITDKHVKAWLGDLKDVVYDVEDLLAEIAYDSHVIAGGQTRRSLKPVDDLSGERAKFQGELQKILERLDDIRETKDILDLKECGHVSEVYGHYSHLERQTTSLVDESEVYGREADKEAITRWLISEEIRSTRGLGVIAIVGMGGLGKTTLAQLVYGPKVLD